MFCHSQAYPDGESGASGRVPQRRGKIDSKGRTENRARRTTSKLDFKTRSENIRNNSIHSPSKCFAVILRLLKSDSMFLKMKHISIRILKRSNIPSFSLTRTVVRKHSRAAFEPRNLIIFEISLRRRDRKPRPQMTFKSDRRHSYWAKSRVRDPRECLSKLWSR